MHVNQAQTALWTEMAADPGDGADRLSAWQPARWPVAPDWRLLVDGFFASPSAQELGAFVRSRLEAGAVVYPPRPLWAFELTPLIEVRVVILGQDPYHGAGQAQGLAFSVAEGQRQPPSLRNIFKELQRDLGLPLPASGSLLRWARQGVLLLNTCLTVEEGQPASHARQGWETLTDTVLAAVSGLPQPVVFMLWGCACPVQARPHRSRLRPGASSGADSQSPFALVGFAPAGAFHRLRAFWSRECLPREARSCARRLVEVLWTGCQNREKAGIIDGSLRRGARVAKGGRL
jgi:uracil-DNA glycosylase